MSRLERKDFDATSRQRTKIVSGIAPTIIVHASVHDDFTTSIVGEPLVHGRRSAKNDGLRVNRPALIAPSLQAATLVAIPEPTTNGHHLPRQTGVLLDCLRHRQRVTGSSTGGVTKCAKHNGTDGVHPGFFALNRRRT